jgi:hypothetical protein
MENFESQPGVNKNEIKNQFKERVWSKEEIRRVEKYTVFLCPTLTLMKD